MEREYYKIRLLDNGYGSFNEFHKSNNGINSWRSLKAVRSIISRGIQSGYHGHIHTLFKNYQIIKVTEIVTINEEIVYDQRNNCSNN